MCLGADGQTDRKGDSLGRRHVMPIAWNAMEAFGDEGCDM
jgi:hypothetical protein